MGARRRCTFQGMSTIKAPSGFTVAASAAAAAAVSAALTLLIVRRYQRSAAPSGVWGVVLRALRVSRAEPGSRLWCSTQNPGRALSTALTLLPRPPHTMGSTELY